VRRAIRREPCLVSSNLSHSSARPTWLGAGIPSHLDLLLSHGRLDFLYETLEGTSVARLRSCALQLGGLGELSIYVQSDSKLL